MKKKKICIGNWKISTDILHWLGFGIAAASIVILTAYGFLLSLRPTSFTLESAPEESLALVGVALANNVGTDTPRAQDIPVELTPDVQGVQGALVRDGMVGAYFFDEHFPRMSEFAEVLNIDVVNYLRLHPDKLTSLEYYISQLEEKKEEGEVALASLNQLVSIHTSALTVIPAQIENIQNGIETAYINRNGDQIMSGLQNLEELRIAEQEHRNTILFANRMAREYAVLITAAEQKITVLKANTTALVKGVTVVLPEGINIKALQDLKIFVTEKQ